MFPDSGEVSSSSSMIVLCIAWEVPAFVLPKPLMRLRSPVIVPRSMLPSSMSEILLGFEVLLALMSFDRQVRGTNVRLMTSLLRLYSRSTHQVDP